MPFTLAHPAAILPLHRLLGRRCVFVALVIGSMVPDSPYFIGLDIDRDLTHSLSGLLLYSLPVGWLAYGLFEFVLRRPLTFLLPPSLAARLAPQDSPRPGWWWVPPSLVFGAFTHIVWDSCTHKHGFLVERLYGLEVLLFRFAGYNFWVYKVLQYLSGVLGLLILALALGWWWRRTPRRNDSETWPVAEGWRLPLRLLLILGPSAGVLVIAWQSQADLDPPMWLRHLVIHGGQFFLVGLAVYALLWWLWEFTRQRRGVD